MKDIYHRPVNLICDDSCTMQAINLKKIYERYLPLKPFQFRMIHAQLGERYMKDIFLCKRYMKDNDH